MARDPQLNRRTLLSAAWLAGIGTVAGISGAGAAPAPPGRTVLASDFGTVGDGTADDTRALQSALDAAFGNTALLLVPPGIYKVSKTLRARMTAESPHQSGISARGAHFMSAIGDGSNVFEFTSTTNARFVFLEGLDILGSARDGHGIYIACEGASASLQNFCIRDAVIQRCGGDGMRLVGSLSEGQVSNSYFRNNHGSGAAFSNTRGGRGISSLHVFGCVFGDNARFGASLTDGCSDVAFHGCYFLQSGSYGLMAEHGCTLLSNCGFENNHDQADGFEQGDAGVHLSDFGTLVGCMAYSMRKQTHLIRTALVGDLVMVGCSGFGGAQARRAGLARLAGDHAASATLVGCSGAVECEGGFEPLEIAGGGGGVKFGADWQSRNLPRFGNYRLWVDERGRLRLKNGRPASDDDGALVGA